MTFAGVTPPIATLLVQLEQLSRNRPDRVLRLRGVLPGSAGGPQDASAAGSSANNAPKSGAHAASESTCESGTESASQGDPKTGNDSTADTGTGMRMGTDTDTGPCPEAAAMEPFELLIFRGFSCSVTHPTDFDPDRPLLPEGSHILAAELLAGPLNPAAEQLLAGPEPVEHFLNEDHWH